MKVLVIDIDGSLADDRWRSTITDHDERQRQAAGDIPVPAMVQLVGAMVKAKWHTIALTARNERWRQLTNRWLQIHDVPIADLQMRADDDYSPAAEYKIKVIKSLILPSSKTMLLIDSREDVVQAYTMEGWTALCTYS